MELWQYSGEPTDDELIQRVELGNSQLGYRHKCPNCGRNNTEFLRNTYWMCHDCIVWFATEDTLCYYNTEAYEQDDRIPEEVLEYIEQGGN